MASGPINSWQIDGETMETAADFIFLGSKFTGDGNCSQYIKRLLLLGRKAMTNLDSTLKSRDITLPTKAYHQKMTPNSIQWHKIKKSDAYGVPSIFLIIGLALLSIMIFY